MDRRCFMVGMPLVAVSCGQTDQIRVKAEIMSFGEGLALMECIFRILDYKHRVPVSFKCGDVFVREIDMSRVHIDVLRGRINEALSVASAPISVQNVSGLVVEAIGSISVINRHVFMASNILSLNLVQYGENPPADCLAAAN